MPKVLGFLSSLAYFLISLVSVLVLSLFVELVGLAGCLGTVEEANNWKELNLNRNK